jgi:hypothetical protein
MYQSIHEATNKGFSLLTLPFTDESLYELYDAFIAALEYYHDLSHSLSDAPASFQSSPFSEALLSLTCVCEPASQGRLNWILQVLIKTEQDFVKTTT